jgi:hypothetical protein
MEIATGEMGVNEPICAAEILAVLVLSFRLVLVFPPSWPGVGDHFGDHSGRFGVVYSLPVDHPGTTHCCIVLPGPQPWGVQSDQPSQNAELRAASTMQRCWDHWSIERD